MGTALRQTTAGLRADIDDESGAALAANDETVRHVLMQQIEILLGDDFHLFADLPLPIMDLVLRGGIFGGVAGGAQHVIRRRSGGVEESIRSRLGAFAILNRFRLRFRADFAG